MRYTYKTGRQRTVTLVGSYSLSGNVQRVGNNIVQGGASFGCYHHYENPFTIGFASVYIYGETYDVAGVRLCADIWCLSGFQTVVLASSLTNASLSGSISGEFSIEIDLEEELDSYGGYYDPVGDVVCWSEGPPVQNCFFNEVYRSNTAMRGTITWNGGSLSGTHSTPVGSYFHYLIRIDSACGYYPTAWGLGTPGGVSSTVNVEWMGEPVNVPDLSFTDPRPGGGTGSGSVADSSVSTSASFPANASIMLVFNPSTEYHVKMKLKCLGDDYPNPSKIRYGRASGIQMVGQTFQGPLISCSDELHIFDGWYYISYSGPTSGGTRGEKGSHGSSVKLELAKSSLALAGEDATDPRLCFRGMKWNALEISRDSTLEIDPCTATTQWTAGPNTFINPVLGNLLITAAGASGSASLQVPSDVQNWEAFRYLKFYCGGSQSMVLDVYLAGHHWTMNVPTIPGYYILDLCCAADEEETVVSRNSRFPVVGDPAFPSEGKPDFQYELGWGVNYCDEIIIEGIPASSGLTLSGIELIRGTGESAISLIDPLRSQVKGWANDTDMIQPFATLQTDGRISDWPGLIKDTNPANPRRPYKIEDIAAMLSSLPGVYATALTGPDEMHGPELFSFYLGGSGYVYDWDDDEWKVYLDTPISGSPSMIPSQDLFDNVGGYPGIGNAWKGGPYPEPGEDGSLPLFAAKGLRGQAAGIVCTTTQLPRPAVSVSATSAEGIFSGSANTAADGTYKTTSYYGAGNKLIWTGIVAPDFDLASPSVRWQNRLRQRTSFRTPDIPCAGAPPRLNFGCSVSSVLSMGSCGNPVGVASNMGACGCNQKDVSPLPYHDDGAEWVS